jgi:hypothetical protein
MSRVVHQPSMVETLAIIILGYFAYYALLWYFQYIMLLIAMIVIVLLIAFLSIGLICGFTLKEKDYVVDNEYE